VASKSPKLDKMEVCHYDKLMALCLKQGITPTTMMEGVLIALGDNEAVMAEVINVAKERRRIRSELGKQRRLDTEIKKMGAGLSAEASGRGEQDRRPLEC
jgi:hypothetical protein